MPLKIFFFNRAGNDADFIIYYIYSPEKIKSCVRIEIDMYINKYN